MAKVWPSLPPLPAPHVPMIGPGGLANRDWYAWFQRMDLIARNTMLLGINDLADVDLSTPPADTEQLTWVDADGVWKAGAA